MNKRKSAAEPLQGNKTVGASRLSNHSIQQIYGREHQRIQQQQERQEQQIQIHHRHHQQQQQQRQHEQQIQQQQLHQHNLDQYSRLALQHLHQAAAEQQGQSTGSYDLAALSSSHAYGDITSAGSNLSEYLLPAHSQTTNLAALAAIAEGIVAVSLPYNYQINALAPITKPDTFPHYVDLLALRNRHSPTYTSHLLIILH